MAHTDGREVSHELHEPITVQSAAAQPWDEDRVEFVNIPSRGKLQTQIFETRTRVHCYFDPDEATWLRLPIAWELYSPAARHLVNLVKDVCPGWGDDADILAALRVSNYNVDDCVNTYHSSIGREEAFTPPLVDSTKTEQKPTLHRPTVTAKRKSQDQTDEAYHGLAAELEKLKHELSFTALELSKEQAAHEQLKIAYQHEKKKRDSKALEKVIMPLRLEQPLQQLRVLCQDVRDILHGSKHLVEDFINTLVPLIKRGHHMFYEQNDRLLETQALYRLEAQQRKLTYNTLIELRGNIRVFCRIRRMDNCIANSNWLTANENGELCAYLSNTGKRKFQFDHVFQVDASQEDLEKSKVKTSIFCFLIPNFRSSIRELLRIINERQKVSFELSMSIVEIYNENVVDLLSPTNTCDAVEIRHTGPSVFVALRNNQLHIPYRNTKLTQMLQPCLGGDAKTCLIVNVTTDMNSVSETLSTLQFGASARQVALGPAKAHVTNICTR
ncbi:Kinesin protein [Fasciola gigantica]|uniref:Kinesin protein n=1 Tax=Fasciola gigantica TaxID=46835 RepID=A0A504Y6Y6_FASGI|nr:Kinesin protein [Fasciola gigantica]